MKRTVAMSLIVGIVVSSLIFLEAAAWNGSGSMPRQEEKKYEMKTYYLVLLKKGPNRNHSKEEAAVLQKGHMDNINRLAEEGMLVMAGPIADTTDLRGIFVFNVESMEKAKELCDSDPAIQSGRLTAEIHPWWAAKGSTLP